jgi:hypothetical protein
MVAYRSTLLFNLLEAQVDSYYYYLGYFARRAKDVILDFNVEEGALCKHNNYSLDTVRRRKVFLNATFRKLVCLRI